MNLIFLNLFIAIILQGFEDTQNKDNRLFNQQTLDNFRDVWAKYDPDATTFIKISKIKDLLLDLGEPLGWDSSYKDNVSLALSWLAPLLLDLGKAQQPVTISSLISFLQQCTSCGKQLLMQQPNAMK